MVYHANCSPFPAVRMTNSVLLSHCLPLCCHSPLPVLLKSFFRIIEVLLSHHHHPRLTSLWSSPGAVRVSSCTLLHHCGLPPVFSLFSSCCPHLVILILLYITRRIWLFFLIYHFCTLITNGPSLSP